MRGFFMFDHYEKEGRSSVTIDDLGTTLLCLRYL